MASDTTLSTQFILTSLLEVRGLAPSHANPFNDAFYKNEKLQVFKYNCCTPL